MEDTLQNLVDTERFQRDGYLILPGVFGPDEVARMRAEADFILELVINSSLANGRQDGRLDLVEDEKGQQHVRKVQPINDLSLFLAQVSNDERLVGPLRRIMGYDPVLMEEKLNYKQPLADAIPELRVRSRGAEADGFSIHNDWAYYQVQGYPQDILSSAVTIDECTVANGAMNVWPGTHRAHVEHVRGATRDLVAQGVDPEAGVPVLAPPGSVLIFHALLLHNSPPNRTAAPRRLMIYSHYPARVKMPFDMRNGGRRLAEGPWEWEYQRKVLRGEYVDRFHAPRHP